MKASARMDAICRKMLVSLLLWLSMPIMAAEKAVTPAQASPVNAGQVLQLLTALLGIVALIVIMAWLVRRSGRININTRKDFRILGMIPMGARERIVLMQLGEQQLLIGVSQQGGIRTLHVLDKNIEFDPGAGGTGFQDKLKSLLDRRRS